MSDHRRRRRAVSDDEGETPPTRRRRYNTRSAVREEARQAWTPTVNIVRIPFLNIRDFTDRHSGSRSRNGSSRSRSRNGASDSRSRDGTSGSRGRPGASGSRSRNGASGSRSLSASAPNPRGGASTSAANASAHSRGFRTTLYRARSSRQANNAGASHSRRTYTAMSTGGRGSTIGSPIPYQELLDRVFGRDRAVHHEDSDTDIDQLPAPLRTMLMGNRRGSSVLDSGLGDRRSENGPLSPRPSRGSNIVSRSTSSRTSRSATGASSSALTIEDVIGIPRRSSRAPATRPASQVSSGSPSVRPLGRRMSTGGPASRLAGRTSAGGPAARGSQRTARMSTGGRQSRTTIFAPRGESHRRFYGLPPLESNAARTRIASGRGNGDQIRYDLTHTGSRLNIRVAFGAEDGDSEPTERLFSISGDSDATTYLNSLSDIDMSADDVFYSDTDRQESDSGESSESGSTATPHSLVSLSLNALHPSPTPSLSSAETNNVDAEGYATTEPEAEEEEEEPTTDEADEDDAFPAPPPGSIFSRTVGNPIIFLHNNISVHLLSSMAELAETFSSLRDRLQQSTSPGEPFRGFTPPRNYPEPARRRVPEGVDCQRAKLIDELSSNTSECVICTDTIKAVDQVWPCNNCFNIFHLPCIRRWAKTNRATEVGGAWICPVCRRPKFCGPNKLRYRCLCGRLQRPKPMPGVTPHCCGKPCRHNCGLLCHPGPCKMSEAEAAAFASQGQTAQPSEPVASEGATGSVAT